MVTNPSLGTRSSVGRVSLVLIGWAIAVAALLAGCSSSQPRVSTSELQPEGAAVVDGGAWLRLLADGELPSAVFVPTATGALGYGGISTDGAVYRQGAVFSADGAPRAFQTDHSLISTTAVSVGGSTYLAGRECQGTATSTDVGVACDPGRVRVYVVDEATLAVTPLDVGEELVDPTGSQLGIEVLAYGENAVLRASDVSGTRLVVLSDAPGEVKTLPSPPGPLRCSSGTTLWADAAMPDETPTHEVEPSGEAVETVAPGLVRLRAGSSSWEPVEGTVASPGGIRGCSAGWLFELSRPRQAAPILIVGAEDQAVDQVVIPEMRSTPFAKTNPYSERFLVADLDQAVLVDPTDGSVDDVGAAPLELLRSGGPSVLTANGQLGVLNERFELDVIR